MGIFLRRTKAGLNPFWIGFWQEDGKRHETTLLRWRGTPPAAGEKEGDAEFERSRADAQNLFKRIRDKGRGKEEEAALVQKIHAARYGGRVGRVKLAELASRWDTLPHRADLTEDRRARVHLILSRFEAFMKTHFPQVTEAGALTAEHFKAFLDAVEEQGHSARSWNEHLAILRSVLSKVDGQSEGFRGYLALIPKKQETTVHRRPFSGDELQAIFEAAKAVDPDLRPVLVAAACTALRRGDVAQLKWDAVDMEEGFVTVKTSKTGETVEIPIFPPLMIVLQEAAKKRRRGVPYVFPAVALAYQQGADALDRRLRKVLAAAGFVTPEKMKGGKYPAPESPAEAVAAVDAGMGRAGWTEQRRQKGLAILQRHLNGETGKDIAAAMGIARGAVSTYLHEMEEAGGVALVSPPKADADTPRRATLAAKDEDAQRKHRGSLVGWHSFRTTFCTLALSNGVPMDLLRRITGHRTAEIVLKHYDRRGREQMKKAIGAAMPKAIAGAVEKREAVEEFVAVPTELAPLLAKATAADWEKMAKVLQKRSKR
jgi:integrase